MSEAFLAEAVADEEEGQPGATQRLASASADVPRRSCKVAQADVHWRSECRRAEESLGDDAASPVLLGRTCSVQTYCSDALHELHSPGFDASVEASPKTPGPESPAFWDDDIGGKACRPARFALCSSSPTADDGTAAESDSSMALARSRPSKAKMKREEARLPVRKQRLQRGCSSTPTSMPGAVGTPDTAGSTPTPLGAGAFGAQGMCVAPWVYLQNPLAAQVWGAVAAAPMNMPAAMGVQAGFMQPCSTTLLTQVQQQQQMQQQVQQQAQQQMQHHLQQQMQQQVQQLLQQQQAHHDNQQAILQPQQQPQSQPQQQQRSPPCGRPQTQQHHARHQQRPSFDGSSSTPPWTTVIMRNLPNGYTRPMLLRLLDQTGFAGRYDFVYLPIDFKTEVGLGFAFVDFVTSGDAELARQRLSGFREWAIPSAKVLEVGWSSAEQQGLAANVERYRNSSVMHESVPEEFRPLKLVEGRPANFPPPTRKVWPPHESFGCRARR
mmetsp:Transcript_61649/g.177449  ORF Transcript_61649/g.177449 Transcript_61649/m.177449 type:complete len:495 (+) Transcript_61649:99-1583(+)